MKQTIGVVGEPAHFLRQAISPYGKRVAVGVKPATEREKIWIYDMDRGTRIPLVADESGGSLYSPAWSPDGSQIAYRTLAGKKSTLLVHPSDGSGEEKTGFEADLITVTNWSPDGRYVATDKPNYKGHGNFENSIRVVKTDSADKPVFEIKNARPGSSLPTGTGSPILTTAAERFTSLRFLGRVGGSRFLQRLELIPAGVATAKSFSTLRTTKLWSQFRCMSRHRNFVFSLRNPCFASSFRGTQASTTSLATASGSWLPSELAGSRACP